LFGGKRIVARKVKHKSGFKPGWSTCNDRGTIEAEKAMWDDPDMQWKKTLDSMYYGRSKLTRGEYEKLFKSGNEDVWGRISTDPYCPREILIKIINADPYNNGVSAIWNEALTLGDLQRLASSHPIVEVRQEARDALEEYYPGCDDE
jgi:hypothetical protein